jgi:hypothetical protein
LIVEAVWLLKNGFGDSIRGESDIIARSRRVLTMKQVTLLGCPRIQGMASNTHLTVKILYKP